MDISPSYRRDGESVDAYQEFRYPYRHPDDDIAESAGAAELSQLTPLEAAFVKWVIRIDDPDEAINQLMRPAYPFDINVSNGRVIRLRPTVSDAINKIRKKFPNLSKYTADYTLGLVHDEIEHLRARNRRKRYDVESSFYSVMCAGSKKSRHEAEIEDTRLLIEFLKLTKELTTTHGTDGPPVPEAQSGNQDGRVDRIITESEEQIVGRPTGDGQKFRRYTP